MLVDSLSQQYTLHDIPKAYLEKWQRLADVVAEILEVPSALIMRVEPEHIAVLVRSNSEGNPYKPNEKADLNTGLYCEVVMFHKKKLEVQDAPEDPDWNNNPDITLNMNYYLGFPLVWPTGEIFGTICVLDEKKRSFAAKYVYLLEQFKEMIETDFAIINQSQILEKLNKELDSFAHTVSHDLKAPTRRVASYLDIIFEDEKIQNTKTNRSLKKIKENIDSMDRIIDDILIFSRSSNKEISKSEVDISSLVKEQFELLRGDFPDQISELHIDPDYMANTDPNLAKLVVNNLLSNALKYTSQSKPTIITFGQIDRQGETVFFLKDNGIGFDQKYAEKIFEPFARLEKSSQYEGTGIGLTTTKRIIERLGGEIWAESQPGVGTTFFFSL